MSVSDPSVEASGAGPGGTPMSGHDDRYTLARPLDAEGARIGFVSCKRCGATLTLDRATPFDVLARHAKWHARTDALLADGGDA